MRSSRRSIRDGARAARTRALLGVVRTSPRDPAVYTHGDMMAVPLLFGLVVGSFLNVVIARVPEGKSVWQPALGVPRVRDAHRLVRQHPGPLLRRAARSLPRVRLAIPWRYPIVEAVTAARVRARVPALRRRRLDFVVAAALLAALIAITAIDLRHQIIPDVITLPGIVAGVVANLATGRVGWLDSLIGIAVGGGIFLVIILVSGGGMGGGDMKLGAMLGAFLGWKLGLLALLLGVLAGGAVAVVLLLLGRKGRKDAIPFGPYLALGGAVAAALGRPEFSRGISAASSGRVAPAGSAPATVANCALDTSRSRQKPSPHVTALTRLDYSFVTASRPTQKPEQASRWRFADRPIAALRNVGCRKRTHGPLLALDTSCCRTMRRRRHGRLQPHRDHARRGDHRDPHRHRHAHVPQLLPGRSGSESRPRRSSPSSTRGASSPSRRTGRSVCTSPRRQCTTTRARCAGATWIGPGTDGSGNIAVPAGITLSTNADPIFNYLGGSRRARPTRSRTRSRARRCTSWWPCPAGSASRLEDAGPGSSRRRPRAGSPWSRSSWPSASSRSGSRRCSPPSRSRAMAPGRAIQLSTATFLANERLEQVRNARWESEPRPVDELGVSPRADERPRERRRHHVRGRGRAARARTATTRAPSASSTAARRRVQRHREGRSPAGHDHRDLPPDDRRRRRRHREDGRRHDTRREAMTMRDVRARRLRAAVSPFGSERGVALPMALLSLVILSALIAGFSVLVGHRAHDRQQPARGGAGARAGRSGRGARALGAQQSRATPRASPSRSRRHPRRTTAGSSCPSRRAVTPSGGFRVTVTNGATAYERRITAVGFVPDDTTAGRRALQKITVTALNPQLIVKDPPAALSVRGELRAGGTLRVDSRTDQSCGPKVGTLARGETSTRGRVRGHPRRRRRRDRAEPDHRRGGRRHPCRPG